MISIRRYMDKRVQSCASDAAPENPPVFFRLCANILEHVGAYVLSGEFRQLQPQLKQLQTTLDPALTADDAAQVEEAIRVILASYSRLARETVQNTAIEMQQIVTVLGQSLTMLSTGTERSFTRLQKIQETLQRTSMIQDVAGLRASLSDAVQLIKEESFGEQQTAARERENFETEVVKIRERLAGNPTRRLPGRIEGTRAISDSLATLPAGTALYVMAFACSQMKAMIQRYGPEAMDDLFLQLIRERLQPIAPANTAYCWTPSSLVGVFERAPDLARLKSEMATLNRNPLVYRVALGNRTAVLKVGISHLIAESSGERADALIAEIDQFSGFNTAGAA